MFCWLRNSVVCFYIFLYLVVLLDRWSFAFDICVLRVFSGWLVCLLCLLLVVNVINVLLLLVNCDLVLYCVFSRFCLFSFLRLVFRLFCRCLVVWVICDLVSVYFGLVCAFACLFVVWHLVCLLLFKCVLFAFVWLSRVLLTWRWVCLIELRYC